MRINVSLEKISKFSIDLPEEIAAEKFADMVTLLSSNVHKSNNSGFSTRKLVMVKCPTCENIAKPVMKIKDGEIVYKNKELTCKSCQNAIPNGEITPARYVCPKCKESSGFYVMNGLEEVKCRKCDTSINLKFNEKSGEYLSENLF